MNLRNLKWSKTEKEVARHAFDVAYEKECGVIRNKLKDMIATASEPGDIWRIHDYLCEQRNIIEKKYDYRYSALVYVFAQLLKEGLLTAVDLQGLNADKTEAISYLAKPEQS